jgi:surfactin synthase thioesterase subunit
MYTQHAWAELPPSIEVMPVLLPGRAQRLAEPPLDSVEAMAAGALRGLRPMLDERPYALFGHSLGASVALEFARLVAAEGGVAQPLHLIVSARLPQGSLKPASVGGGRLLSEIADDREFITAIHGKYGTLQMVLDNPELMEMVLPMMRADFRAAETYALAPLESPLPVRAPSLSLPPSLPPSLSRLPSHAIVPLALGRDSQRPYLHCPGPGSECTAIHHTGWLAALSPITGTNHSARRRVGRLQRGAAGGLGGAHG